nr:PREDICTED: BRCA1-A complex subunit Abraxas isoform X2 [Lepisosteus oculatus]
MAENTRVCVSGYVLGSLIFHHFNNDSDVEGFILGEIKAEEKNDITDSQMEHVQFEHTIDIAKHVTCYKLNSFYGYLGELKEEEIKKILSRHKKDNVVGWYRQRRNTDHRMTFRDQIIHRNLQRAFSNYELVFLLLTTSEMSSRGSTYRLEYSIFKAHGSQFHKIPVLVTNLGMLLQQDYCRTSVSCSSAGYKRAINKHRSRFFASDGSLKEVNDVNEMNSSLQEELKQTCARVEESERAMEKLLTEVAQLRKAVAERRRVQSKSEGSLCQESSGGECVPLPGFEGIVPRLRNEMDTSPHTQGHPHTCLLLSHGPRNGYFRKAPGSPGRWRHRSKNERTE